MLPFKKHSGTYPGSVMDGKALDIENNSLFHLIKSFCGGMCAKSKAQGAKRIRSLTLCAERHAPCAFPLAAGGKKLKPTVADDEAGVYCFTILFIRGYDKGINIDFNKAVKVSYQL